MLQGTMTQRGKLFTIAMSTLALHCGGKIEPGDTEAARDRDSEGESAGEWAYWPMPNPASAGLPNPARYTATVELVTDDVTGLQWQRDPTVETFTWEQAAQHCATMELESHADWRVPNQIELYSLVDYSRSHPALDPVFRAGASRQWTSSPAGPTAAKIVDFIDGHLGYDMREATLRVRCVRGVSPAARGEHYQLEDETPGGSVRDLYTGLVWQRTLPAGSFTWAQAQEYCSTLGVDWRVPSVKELRTLIDISDIPLARLDARAPRIDTEAFPATPDDLSSWTSSRFPYPPDRAWRVKFFGGNYMELIPSSINGHVSGVPLEDLLSVRCVR